MSLQIPHISNKDKRHELVGKTIQSIENIRAEFGRTYDAYDCLVFTDGTRALLASMYTYNPSPTVEEMSKAPKFFSADDIAEKVLMQEQAKRKRIAEDERIKRSKLEQLKRELGE